MPHAKSTSKLPLPQPPLPSRDARWAVMLDVDGVLLDVANDAGAVVVAPALLELLDGLHKVLHGALALVSSRGLDEIDSLFGRPAWAVVGLLGMELRHADGSFRRRDSGIASRTGMRVMVSELAARFEGVQVEDSERTIVLHCGDDPARLAALRAEAKALLPHLPGYELSYGRDWLQFKPGGMEKGRAVRELFRHQAFAGRTPIYLGDGFTDEHAFKRVNRLHGHSIGIGTREPNAAHFMLADPAAAQAWLRQVLGMLLLTVPAQGECPES